MVITRAQSTTNAQARYTDKKYYRDNESDIISWPELNSHDLINKNSSHHSDEQERDHEQIRIERRFNEMN